MTSDTASATTHAAGPLPGPLEGVRVLDLATERAEMAGRILADLGAEVLKVEPPGGVRARTIPPFDERPGRAPGGVRSQSEVPRSLYWAALGLGKRSLVLDLERDEDRERLAGLARQADVLIESFGPGVMAAMGLAYEALAGTNARLVYVSVAPYGQHGPKAGWQAGDLVLEAAGGRLFQQGDRDRPPVPVGYPQASFHSGAQAAADAVIALNERDRSGVGQHLDLSMQEVMVWTLMDGPGYVPLTGDNPPGGGDDRALGGRRPGSLVPCRDGYVIVTLAVSALNVVMPSILAAVEAPEHLDGIDWANWQTLVAEGRVEPSTALAVQQALQAFFDAHTKQELLDWAISVDLRLAPVQSTADVVRDPHLEARDYWQPAEGGPPDERYPRPPVRFSRTPVVLRTPAPALDEGGADLVERWQAAAREAAPQPSNATKRPDARLGEAFAGLKIADFSWVAAGPMTAKAFGDHGATVVKVESATRLDLARSLPPFLGGVPGVNHSQWNAVVNTSKLSAAVNLGVPEGREVARRLIDWADVVVEAFTPGTMARLGLDYETVTRDRDDLIMLSTCQLGQTGPRARYGGYGQHGAALSGLHGITGWPDRPPAGPHGPYTDVITPRFGVPALAAAIFERRRSGKGQHIDLSQVEAAIHFLEPAILDELWNGRTAPPAGLASAVACPHGVYRTAGTERYIAIAIETPEQWHALLRVAPVGGFTDEPLDTLEARRVHQAAIDRQLATWVATQDPFALEALLAGEGVPAAVVARMTDLHRDPQLADRGFFVPLEHPVMGTVPYDGPPTHFSAKRVRLHRAAPALGEHTDYVLRELLGLPPEEVARYAVAGALT